MNNSFKRRNLLTRALYGGKIGNVSAYEKNERIKFHVYIRREHVMELLNKTKAGKIDRPVKVVQFGEGNFLRAFVDYMIDIANEKDLFGGDIVLIKPIEFGDLSRFHAQDCQYTVSLRGIDNGEAKVQNRIITSVKDAVGACEEYEKYNDLAKIDTLRFVVSNTTEAGIVYDENDKFELCPPNTFPGKLTKFLYTRFQEFNGAEDKGLIMLPVELIDDNGMHLKECVLKQCDNWKLPEEFKKWVNTACVFTQTLVDRIVTGYPRDSVNDLWNEWGYKDEICVTAEPFALWVIESEKDISAELPLDKAGLPVVFTKDHHPYKQRKVRILNGAHTSFVLAGFLAGNDIVLECMNDRIIRSFIENTIFTEIIPTLTLSKEECEEFAKAVLSRFDNPYVKHALLSISLNSVSKWKARCMPSFVGYIDKFGKVPEHLAFSIAALCAFYTGSEIRDKALIGHRDGKEYNIMDDMKVLEFFRDNSSKDSKEYVKAVLSNKAFWDRDLSQIPGVLTKVSGYLDKIREIGMKDTLKELFD